MEVKCENCDGTSWKAILHEIRMFGQNVIYSAIKCDGCGAVYPLAQLGKNQSIESIRNMLK